MMLNLDASCISVSEVCGFLFSGGGISVGEGEIFLLGGNGCSITGVSVLAWDVFSLVASSWTGALGGSLLKTGIIEDTLRGFGDCCFDHQFWMTGITPSSPGGGGLPVTGGSNGCAWNLDIFIISVVIKCC